MTAKKVIRTPLLICVALLAACSCAFADVSPLNPAYVKYMEKQGTALSAARTLSVNALSEDIEEDEDDLSVGTGYEPSPLYWEHLRDKAWDLTDGREITSADSARSTYSSYPSYYTSNLSSTNLGSSYSFKDSMPAVRNQNSFNNCWVYAAMGATEANLIKKGIASKSIELSEWYLTYYGHNNWYDGMAPFYSSSTYYYAGGNDWKAVALLARGTGSVKSYYSPNISSTSQAYAPLISSRDYKLVGAYYLGGFNDSGTYVREVPLSELRREMIKQAIYDYGAVSVGIYSASMKKSNAGYNSSTGAYYSGKTLSNVSTDHAVVLVGWNDNYSKNNFSSGYQPQKDGAWIARNSWGSSWGNMGGYFYISYEEATLCDGVAYETVKAPDNEKIYQYDPLGCTGWASYGDGDHVFFANLFDADVDDKINSVSFYVPDTGIKYEVSVYTDCTDSPVDGKKEDSVAPENLIPGYNTVPLSKEVSVDAGTKFSVVVKADVTNATYKEPIPVEYKIGTSYQYVSANAGEGWVSTDGESFADVVTVPGFTSNTSNTSICLKAFGEAGESNKRVSSVTSSDSGGSGCSMGVSALSLLVLAPIALYAKRRKS